MKRCKKCGKGGISETNLYCRTCEKVVIQELKECGYLGPNPRLGFNSRTKDQRQENAGDVDANGYLSNARRDLEEG